MARFQAGALVVYGNLGVHEVEWVGLPTIVMQAIGSVMTFAVNGILLGVSSTAVAFFGIYYKLQNFLMMPVNGLGQAAIPVVGFNYGSGQSDRVKQAWKVLLPTGVVFALCGTAVFLLFPAQLLGLFSASDEMLAFGVPALRIISVTFLFAVTTILCGYFASGLGNGVVNMIGGALRQLEYRHRAISKVGDFVLESLTPDIQIQAPEIGDNRMRRTWHAAVDHRSARIGFLPGSADPKSHFLTIARH